ncbi:hypothetical protein BH23ACT11_BH23ACT11_13880 [soil metagenome]
MASPSSETGPGYDGRDQSGPAADKARTEQLNRLDNSSREAESGDPYVDEPTAANLPHIGRYRAIRGVGEGGMADVYLAHDDILDRDVALKILRRGPVDDQRVERFRREARSAAALSHPNIVAIYDWGEADGGSYYLVMEYLPGGTVKELIDREGPLPAGKVVSIAIQTALALEMAHGRGLVHRDIKPQNILLDAARHVKVTDFGIARVAATPAMTEPGTMVGTVHYVSPEQASGDPVEPASDLYSLGAVLYEMLTGQVPYDAEDPIAIVMKHLEGRLTPTKELNPDVPEALDYVTTKLLARDPGKRYASASGLIGDLKEIPAQGLTATLPLSKTRTMPASRNAATREGPLRPESTRRTRTPLLVSLLVLLTVVAVVLGLRVSGAASLTEQVSFLGFGAEKVEVPDVTGESNDAAAELLRSKGFEVSTRAVESSVQDKGMVVDQAPTEGRLKSGATVDITVGQGPPPAEDPELLRESVEDYYGAVDREEWSYTYSHLDSKSQALFTEEEWARRNQFLADNFPGELSTMRVAVEINSDDPADVTTYRTFKSGSSLVRDTLFVYEEGMWKHRLVEEELDLFQMDLSYDEFVSYYGG